MNNLLKSWLISVTFAAVPLNVNSNNFENIQNNLKNQTNVELFDALKVMNDKEIMSSYVDPKIITDAMLSYFDEEVKIFKLSPETKIKIVAILNSYLSSHPVLFLWNEWKMNFVIDDKREFTRVVKQLVNIIINDMPFLVRKVWVPLVFGWNDKLQEKLDNLDITLNNMKEKQYKDVIFDYVWWIVKRVAKSVNWKMEVKQYYDDISGYFPNKNSVGISQQLSASWMWNVDIKYMKYPFNK